MGKVHRCRDSRRGTSWRDPLRQTTGLGEIEQLEFVRSSVIKGERNTDLNAQDTGLAG
jgi:hypothetical protein